MKKYQIIYADPPWPIRWRASEKIGTKPLAYPTMTISELCALPVKDIADDYSMLFMWVTNEFLPEGLGIIKFWGFQYNKLWTWCKPTCSGGHPRNATEHIIEAGRGMINSIGKHEKAINNWFQAPTKGHSVKPGIARKIIEHCYPNTTKIELFARQKTEGWDCIGNEINGKDIKQQLEEMINE